MRTASKAFDLTQDPTLNARAAAVRRKQTAAKIAAGVSNNVPTYRASRHSLWRIPHDHSIHKLHWKLWLHVPSQRNQPA